MAAAAAVKRRKQKRPPPRDVLSVLLKDISEPNLRRSPIATTASVNASKPSSKRLLPPSAGGAGSSGLNRSKTDTAIGPRDTVVDHMASLQRLLQAKHAQEEPSLSWGGDPSLSKSLSHLGLDKGPLRPLLGLAAAGPSKAAANQGGTDNAILHETDAPIAIPGVDSARLNALDEPPLAAVRPNRSGSGGEAAGVRRSLPGMAKSSSAAHLGGSAYSTLNRKFNQKPLKRRPFRLQPFSSNAPETGDAPAPRGAPSREGRNRPEALNSAESVDEEEQWLGPAFTVQPLSKNNEGVSVVSPEADSPQSTAAWYGFQRPMASRGSQFTPRTALDAKHVSVPQHSSADLNVHAPVTARDLSDFNDLPQDMDPSFGDNPRAVSPSGLASPTEEATAEGEMEEAKSAVLPPLEPTGPRGNGLTSVVSRKVKLGVKGVRSQFSVK